MKKIIFLNSAIISVLFITFGISFGGWTSNNEVSAQTNNQENSQVLAQLIQNLTQAQNTVSTDNSTVSTTQLTAIIGELSDILGKITTDNNGQYLDEHTHFFTHKDHTHTVTHTHPHHSDHHSHHQSWTEKHHIFDPGNCKPGRMC
jgi:archaellum component FlaF (FlaF/FlaG flagellin family)